MYERQLIFNNIDLFSSNKKTKFYEKIFDVIDLSEFPMYIQSKFGPKGFNRHALFRSFIVMKAEKIREITELVNFLDTNPYIAYLCGLESFKALPSYSVFQRLIKNIDNDSLKNIMKSQVLKLKELGFIDSSFVSCDGTPIFANTKQNNPKSFAKNKFSKSNHPKSDLDCKLSVHTASNSHNKKKYDFYWGYQNIVLTDAISGLPIDELTTTADVCESTICIDFLKSTNSWFSLDETYFIADKSYDTRKIHNFIRYELNGHAFIPLNPRNTKKKKMLNKSNVICDAGLAMHKDGRQYFDSYIKQKFCCTFRTKKDDSLCPCKHPKYFNGKKNRGCTKYISIGNDYRASINRDSKFFKKIYAFRTDQ
ncbi:MAG: transposase [Clostridiaceae bacterium]|nr:transposase [Clostridiaceae bacterium]MBW4860893.1 transposase [Clostridiaceae bacterium]MBW4867518.1 transposase [Clostridiaceae bacterium]